MSDYKRIDPPAELLAISPTVKAYLKGVLKVFYAEQEEMEPHWGFVSDMGAHLSISHPHRYPTWQEIKDARYTFMPSNKLAYMILPPQDEYVNIHPNCFHLWMPVERKIQIVRLP